MHLRDIHYDYVVNVMEQDPGVIKEMISLIDEIEMITFICDVDVVVCTSLVDSINLDILKGSE